MFVVENKNVLATYKNTCSLRVKLQEKTKKTNKMMPIMTLHVGVDASDVDGDVGELSPSVNSV